MSEVHATAAQGYGQGAQVYARGRPDFPPGALEWLVKDLGLDAGKTAIELGAGTGKFTKLLTQSGATVIAVEPVAAMLAQLASDLPDVRTLRASAQALPLADASADVVVCAQSFHWFASHEALAEIHRVLKPGGLLGLIWNVRDASIGWIAELSEIYSPFEGDAPRHEDGEWRTVFPAPGFGPLLEKSVTHAHTGSTEQVIVDRTASISFVAALPEPQRQSLLEDVRALIARTPELAGKPAVSMPYVTKMYWCRTGVVR